MAFQCKAPMGPHDRSVTVAKAMYPDMSKTGQTVMSWIRGLTPPAKPDKYVKKPTTEQWLRYGVEYGRFGLSMIALAVGVDKLKSSDDPGKAAVNFLKDPAVAGLLSLAAVGEMVLQDGGYKTMALASAALYLQAPCGKDVANREAILRLAKMFDKMAIERKMANIEKLKQKEKMSAKLMKVNCKDVMFDGSDMLWAVLNYARSQALYCKPARRTWRRRRPIRRRRAVGGNRAAE